MECGDSDGVEVVTRCWTLLVLAFHTHHQLTARKAHAHLLHPAHTTHSLVSIRFIKTSLHANPSIMSIHFVQLTKSTSYPFTLSSPYIQLPHVLPLYPTNENLSPLPVHFIQPTEPTPQVHLVSVCFPSPTLQLQNIISFAVSVPLRKSWSSSFLILTQEQCRTQQCFCD